MSTTLLYLGDCIVNLAHVVMAEFEPPEPADTYFDEDYGKELERAARKARLTLTLSSVEKDIEHGYEGAVDGVGTKSKTKKVYGDVAEQAWDFLRRNAVSLAGEAEAA